MVDPHPRKPFGIPPALELCGWLMMLAFGIMDIVYEPRHLGRFGAWLQIAVSSMGIVASLWRWRTGD